MIEKLYSIFLNSTGICTDSRSLEAGNLFLALKGPSFNANEFILEALESGAYACVADEDRDEYKNRDDVFLVSDGLKSLQDLALHHRKKLKIPVIGLTGSNGKTTTKELMYAALSQRYRTYATRGNLNNHIGVPLSVLGIHKTKHEIAIIEMGANHQEEIAELCEIALPDFGVITNIGLAHLEGFGGEEGIYKGKKELFDFINKTAGKVFVNADDAKVLKAANGLEKIQFGTEVSNHISGNIIPDSALLQISWTKHSDPTTHHLTTQLTGEYNFSNVLAAVCIANYFGVDPKDINEGIKDYAPDNNRSQIEHTDKGNEVILDCYNANPSSMEAALTNLDHYPSDKPKIVVLGDMLELGDHSVREHQITIDQLASLDLHAIYLVGPEFETPDLGKVDSSHFQTTADLSDHLSEKQLESSVILLKGSRKMKLEQLFELL